MTGSFQFALEAVEWNVFLGLSYADEPVEEATVVRHGLQFLRSCALHDHVVPSQMLYALRCERGERFNRLHLHALISVNPGMVPFYVARPGVPPQVRGLWGRGYVKARRILDVGDPAVSYVLKGKDGGFEYELRKSYSADRLVLSAAAVARARGRKARPVPRQDAIQALTQALMFR